MRNRLLILAFTVIFLTTSLSAQEAPPPDGNTPGNNPAGVTIHVVQRGENLFRIALSYGLTTEQVAQANGIANPASILVGQRLIIPTAGVATPEPPQTHIVQAGESLQSIADLYGLTLQELALRNGIANPNAIYVGQELTITDPTVPPESPTEPAPAPAPAPVEQNPPPVAQLSAENTGVTHIVAPGETLFRIATNYGLTVSEVQTANSISDPTVIFVGQEIFIPGIEPPPLALDLPTSITGVDLNPQLLTEGKTARIRIQTATPSTVTVSLLGQTPPVITESETSYVALLPVPLGTAPEVYPLALTISPVDGSPPDTLTLNVQVLNGGYGSQFITLPADRLNLVDINIENAEVAILTGVMPFNFERYYSGTMSLPAAAPMNAPYGAFRAYNGGPFDRYHTGADFAGATGTPILAAESGRVVLSDGLNIRGQTVVIDHGWGVYSTYSHMSQRMVNVGDTVTIGQTIGLIGSTGRATGAHLHWEIWVNGIPVEPMQWLSQTFP